jgi:MFS family permease
VLVPSVGALIGGSFLVALRAVSTPAVAVLIIVVGYGVMSFGLPLYLAAVSDVCPLRQTAGMLGVLTAVVGVGGMVGPYMTGLIVDAAPIPAEGYATAFQFVGVLAVVCAVAAILLANPERDKLRLT